MIRAEKLNPIIKWAGGKEKELSHILPLIPRDSKRYFEPFVGGGAVFFAVNFPKMYINDKSIELINLYNKIKFQDVIFLNGLNLILNSWKSIELFVEKKWNILKTNYLKFSENELIDKAMIDFINEFAYKYSDKFEEINKTSPSQNNLLNEIIRNLKNKTFRMKSLEREKGNLSEKDIYDNIECAFKSALYMHFRYLYNNTRELSIDESQTTAIFYFVREHCYASMFRYNSSGKFNVPYGGISYNRKDFGRKINYLSSQELVEQLKSTEIYNMDFEEFLNITNPGENDFIFLDPPYDSDFSTYANNFFGKNEQVRLANFLINKCKSKFLLVIKNTDFIRDIYSNNGLYIKAFNKKYLVSFQDRNNKNTEHLIITNYQI